MDIVTGSFGYIGKYITQELIHAGRRVKTITTHPEKHNPFGDQVQAFPYHFEQPDRLVETLRGCDTLFNTYWVRFNYRDWSFDQALANTKILFACAKGAGVRKIVHISVTNPSELDELPYYKGKALQERALKESGIPFSIIRPTLVFGKEDILVNNIAWTIRKFPVVPIFGSGNYRVQPVFVSDLAKIACECVSQYDSTTLDAIGPEAFTYQELVQLIAAKLGRKMFLVHTPPSLGIWLGSVIGLFVRDVVLTRDELRGLMANKLTSSQKPNGKTKFSDWLETNQDNLGRKYTSELKRHFFWKIG
jgi:uncharacterized protein YbjT (DUF2867 family)